MKQQIHLSRRQFGCLALATTALPRVALAMPFQELTWEELIPPGVPYSEIIGEGALDEENDTWNPIFDENATKLNTALDGASVKLPGYIIPMQIEAEGVSAFILVPYTGACIHVPPPPPNQLVYVTTQTPWPSNKLWDAIWVYGRLKARLQSTEIAEIGYEIVASKIEIYDW
ncbi:hypothetical protein SAMN04488117_10259 [Celeribacter baekdonensis]|uniref:DUF3299 domain-containing protein n=1 Tax=Celeribacter baekdonensis TaxID=875171 RepID=A0A1G7HSY5_9RHOB|nr:DUF3299 domain-containing protein [Celeribacter baekdonensis]SDF03364.1 hypothetical protein SAMN04488117_10259 [Celeribacter baekdonensis]